MSKNKEKTAIETRSRGEIRAISDDGIFEGYLTVWDTTDDYNSTFQRGSFKKTIEERGSKVKVLFNHDELIGSSFELREDDHGVFGKGKLNLDSQRAKEVHSFMKNGDLEGLSFGFRTIKEGFRDGVRVIKEVALYEYGPVVFPANGEALITDVRSEDFDVSHDEKKLFEGQSILTSSLHDTIHDIWVSDSTTKENIVSKFDEQLAKFHAAHLQYVQDFVDMFWSDAGTESRSIPQKNDLSKSIYEFLQARKTSIEELASETEFTKQELADLRNGKLILNRNKLESLSEEVRHAHKELRNEAVETLCSELRAGLTDSEKSRILSLLEPVEEQSSQDDKELRKLADYFDSCVN